jgi:hexosaminidase
MHTRFLCSAVALLTIPTLAAAQPLPVVPAVADWQPAAGTVKVDPLKWTYSTDGSADIDPLLGALRDDLPQARFVKSAQPQPGGIHLALAGPAKGPAGAYGIEIGKGRVLISSSSPAGLYHGTRTILQLLAASPDLPAGRINDAPKYPVRSLLIDVGRKFATPDELKDWLRLLGWFKFSELHLHLNDNSWGRYPGYRLESQTFPGLASKDGHYTWKEIRELQDFAAARGIRILPEIDAPGHSLAFTTYNPRLARPELDRKGFGLAYLDVGNPEAIRFMEKLIDEVAPHFDSPEFHIGTDEYRIGLIRDPETRKQAGENFRKWINHFARYLDKKHGKKTRIWSGFEHLPGTTEPDKSIIVDMWETSDAKAKSAGGYHFVNSSHFFTYIVPGAPYYGVSNKRIYEKWTPLIFANKKGAILDPGDPGLLGGKLHIWNDYGPTGFTWNEIARLALPSLAAFSEKLWGTMASPDYAAFQKRSAAAMKGARKVKLLSRSAAPKSGSLVWKLDGERECIPNTAIEIRNPSDNLEWPWTASFTITRKHDVEGDEILIGSDLAAFYLDLTHPEKVKNKQTKKVETLVKRGVACVRANQAPGCDPLAAHTPYVLVFDYQVPLNRKVTLTFVGEQNKTRLYADGKLVGSVRKQMICPLGRIGAQKRPVGFHGTLHAVEIKAAAPKTKTLGKWSPQSFRNGKMDFSAPLPGAPATVTFAYTGGAHGADISQVEIRSAGEVVHRFGQSGFAGGHPENNVFAVPASLTGKPELSIRATVTGRDGTDSHGRVVFSTAP